jgi:hypothetical protein
LRIPTGDEDATELKSTNVFESDFDGTRNGRKITNRGRGKNGRKSSNKKSSNSKFSAACLPDQDEILPEYDEAHCTIVGWGKEKNSHVYGTEVLHEAEVIIFIIFVLDIYPPSNKQNNLFPILFLSINIYSSVCAKVALTFWVALSSKNIPKKHFHFNCRIPLLICRKYLIAEKTPTM